jgi:ABC-type multidrug transport system fused ATPase/permease subunit
VNLILKFYIPQSGSICLDGNDLRKISSKWLREQIGVVSQEVFLFNDTIEKNIKYGYPQATKEEVISAAQKASIHDDILSFPQKYETEIGERGVKLSAGQRQRISIARAFLKNPPILIFDEPTSALDADTENLIKDSLVKLMGNRTTFIISHRSSVIDIAGKILILDKGKKLEIKAQTSTS